MKSNGSIVKIVSRFGAELVTAIGELIDTRVEAGLKRQGKATGTRTTTRKKGVTPKRRSSTWSETRTPAH